MDTRESLWPTPEYEELVASGVPVPSAFWQKWVRDAIAPMNTDSGRWGKEYDTDDIYRRGVAIVREAAAAIKGGEDIASHQFFDDLKARFDAAGWKGIHAVVTSTVFGGIYVSMSSINQLTVKHREQEMVAAKWPQPPDPIFAELAKKGYTLSPYASEGISLKWAGRKGRSDHSKDKHFADMDAVRAWAYLHWPNLQPGARLQKADKPARTQKEPAATTEENPAGVKTLGDFGEKIGGARKDRYRAAESKPEDKFFADGKRKLKREEIWPVPNHEAVVASGVTPIAAYLRKFIREQVAATPYPETNWVSHDKFDLYTRGVAVVRKLTEEIRGREDVDGGVFALKLKAALRAEFPNLDGERGTVAERTVFGGDFLETRLGRPLMKGFVDDMAKQVAMFDWPKPRDPIWGKIENLGYKASKFDETGIKLEWPAKRSWRAPREYKDLDAMRTWLYTAYPKLKPPSERTEEERKDEIVEIPHLAHIRREDLPQYREEGYNVTPDDFLTTFGVRGVEFGNWLPGDERQEVLNRAFDSMLDLCAALEWEPQELSLGGRLGLAFGSRGHGGKRAALAHFEPGNFVMNMTRIKGAGSFAHEFLHAWDCHMGSLAGCTLDKPYATENTRSAWPGGNGLGGNSKKGYENYTSEQINAFVAAQYAMRKLWRTAVFKPDAKTGEETRDGTDYYYAAARIDRKEKRSGEKKYWSSGRELCARAFAAWTEDRLHEMGGKNQYLSHSTRVDLNEGVKDTTLSVYPQGPVRERMAAAFTEAAALSRAFVLPPPKQEKVEAIDADQLDVVAAYLPTVDDPEGPNHGGPIL